MRASTGGKVCSKGESTDSIETTAPLIRLTVSDTNQCKSFFILNCIPTGLNEQGIIPFLIYPNPAKASFRIATKIPFISVHIYSTTGMKVGQQEFPPQTDRSTPINFYDWPSGIYFGTIGFGENKFNFKLNIL